MNLIEIMIEEALNDKYFFELLDKVELNYTNLLFNKGKIQELKDKEFFDLLRFADILSYDNDSEGKNLAYSVLSALYMQYSKDSNYKIFANTVLTRLGNFPSLDIIVEESLNYDILETRIEKAIKEHLHKTPDGENIFTDAQYEVFERLKGSNHFSFSGPTSFGKSFVIDAFINYIIKNRRGLDNIVVLVPTRALINQVSQRLKKTIVKEYKDSYEILTQPVVPYLYRIKIINIYLY